MTENVVKRVCIECGKAYIPKTIAQKYCGQPCVIKANARLNRKHEPEEIVCIHCGKIKLVKYPNPKHPVVFCRTRCRTEFFAAAIAARLKTFGGSNKVG